MTKIMKISPKYSVDDWKVLTFNSEEDWQKAIDIFEDRIRGRFLKIVDIISKYEFAGFAVLSLSCLLIETLQQFREGKAQTPRNKSGRYFIQFLTETSFKNFFTKNSAKMFYDQFRCGILHQGEVKEESRVLIRNGVPLVCITQDRKGLIINRMLFYKQLVKVFEKYVYSLRVKANDNLRKNFKKKMDYICRIVIV